MYILETMIILISEALSFSKFNKTFWRVILGHVFVIYVYDQIIHILLQKTK